MIRRRGSPELIVALLILLLTNAGALDASAATGYTTNAVADIDQDALIVPRIDEFDRNSWQRGLPVSAIVSDFRQNQPGDGEPTSLPTTAYLAYDDDNLYVLFECSDDPTDVRARLAKRENIGDDDQVSVYLDTFHDRRRAYVFSANPLGVQR